MVRAIEIRAMAGKRTMGASKSGRRRLGVTEAVARLALWRVKGFGDGSGIESVGSCGAMGPATGRRRAAMTSAHGPRRSISRQFVDATRT